MDSPIALPLTIHLLGFALWITGLLGMATTLVARNDEKDTAFRTKMGALARKAGRSADVGAALSVLGGLWILGPNASSYMHQPWMHAKLTLVVVLLGLHGFLRVKAKKASQSQLGEFPPAMVAVVTLVATCIVALVVFKPGHH